MNLPDGCTAVPGWTTADRRYDEIEASVEAEWRIDGLAQCDGCSWREEMRCHQSERFPDECGPFRDEVEERMSDG